jgi:hypothetical protein
MGTAIVGRCNSRNKISQRASSVVDEFYGLRKSLKLGDERLGYCDPRHTGDSQVKRCLRRVYYNMEAVES